MEGLTLLEWMSHSFDFHEDRGIRWIQGALTRDGGITVDVVVLGKRHGLVQRLTVDFDRVPPIWAVAMQSCRMH